MEPPSEVTMSTKTTICDSTQVAHTGQYNFKTLSSIDTLYYFAESNGQYPDFFIQSVDDPINKAIESYGGRIPKDSLKLELFGLEFTYLNKGDGFHFFRDKANLFRIGFKDPKTITNVHDIWIQTEFLGVYAMGIVRLTRYINKMIASISLRNYFVNRADLNMFVPFDLLSYIDTDNIVTTKRKEGKIFGERKGYETLYIGKNPAKLRIYDKYKEAHVKNKEILMAYILEQHGIKFENPLCNLEFQLSRSWFKQFKINTLDDLFTNAVMIFHKCMKMVRVIDTLSISEKDRAANRMYKAKNDPLWEYLKNSYRFDPMKQNILPLERVQYEKKRLTQEHFIMDFEKLIDKYDNDGVKISRETLLQLLHAQRLMHTKEAFDVVNPREPIRFITPNQDYTLTQNMTPVITLPYNLSKLDEATLQKYDHQLNKALHQELAMDRTIDGERHYPDTNLIINNLTLLQMEIEARKAGEGS